MRPIDGVKFCKAAYGKKGLKLFKAILRTLLDGRRKDTTQVMNQAQY